MLKRINQHVLVACATLFAVMGFFFLHRLAGDSPKVADIAGLIVCWAFFGVTAIAGLLEDLERKLSKWLESKVGYAPQASAPIDPYPQRPHRYDLEQSLVYALAPGLLNRMDGTGVGAFIRAAADAILRGGLPVAKPACTCGPNEGCTNCPSSGAMADKLAEAEIVGQGLTAPRVTAEQIQALMAKLIWVYEQPEGTTSTFAHAYLGRFYLITGHSACVSPENFDAALGMKYAREQAEGKARDKLWELEGYALAKRLGTV